MQLQINGVAVPVNIRCAFSWAERAAGLLFDRDLPATMALWLRPCASVHTIGMAYPIDVVFLDRDGIVRKVAANLKPLRFAAASRVHSAMEFRGGEAGRLAIRVGDRLNTA